MGTARVSSSSTELIARSSLPERLGASAVALVCLGVLGVAAWLSPASEGHGTHTQLGMPACTWVQVMDKPCPTCGMTTSFTHAAEGSWGDSLAAQPFGAFLALMTAVIFWGATHQALTGSRIGSAAQGLLRRSVVAGFVVLVLAAWGYKIATWG